ncbi:MFS transporter [Streptomyces sp. NPDC054933]
MTTTEPVAYQYEPTAPDRSAPARKPPRSSRASHGTGFWFVAAAFMALMAFGTVPTPLWPLYQARDHFGPTVVTVAFAVMVVGAAASFLTLGHLSDRFGRRRIVVPALLVATLASVTLLAWPALPGLIVGRLLTGVAVGLMASTATTYLADLYHEAHPDREGSPVPGLVAAASNLGGLALGPLIAGLLAEWAPAPLVTPYALFAIAMLGFLVLVLSTPETVDLELPDRQQPTRFALRPGAGPAFAAASVVGFFAFAALGLFSSLGAIIIRGQLHITSHAIAGVAPFTMFAASAIAQLALGTLPLVRLMKIGVVLFPGGMALTAVSLYHPTLTLFLVAAGIAGAGAGLLFKGAASQIAMAAAPTSRAGVLAMFFVIAYIGMGAPSIAFSMVIQHVRLQPAMIGFAIMLSCGAMAAAAATSRSATRRRARGRHRRATRRASGQHRASRRRGGSARAGSGAHRTS